jgi:hypothetical protein
MFLSRDELQDLTDLKLPHAQCRWLSEHGYPYDVSASGKPKVLRSYVERRLCPSTAALNGDEPNFDALK